MRYSFSFFAAAFLPVLLNAMTGKELEANFCNPPESKPVSAAAAVLDPDDYKTKTAWDRYCCESYATANSAGKEFCVPASNTGWQLYRRRVQLMLREGTADDNGRRKIKIFENRTPKIKLNWRHLLFDNDLNAFFIAQEGNEQATARCVFRFQNGKTPELWNAETGEIFRAGEWSEKNGETTVSVPLSPAGSMFVVFRRYGSASPVLPDYQTGSETEIIFSKTGGEFSGVVKPPQMRPGEQLRLDLGGAHGSVTVESNGKSYPTLWKAPYRLNLDAPVGSELLTIKIKPEEGNSVWPTPDGTGKGKLLVVRNKNQLGFTHAMPPETNEPPTNPSRNELAKIFRDPFGKIQTGVYWYWLSGNVSTNGIVNDLTAMKKAGIDRAYIGDIGGGGNQNGPVRTFSEEWWDALRTAINTAAKVGVELGIFNSPGWSQSGGPWISHQRAMRRLAYSQTIVHGPKNGTVELAKPTFEGDKPDEYQDVAVVAYPMPKDFDRELTGKGPFSVKAGESSTAEFNLTEPFTARSLVVNLKPATVTANVEVWCETDGKLNRIMAGSLRRTNGALNVGFIPFAPEIFTFPAARSTRFQVRVAKTGGNGGVESVTLRGQPGIAQVFNKTLAKMFESPLPLWPEYQWPDEPTAEEDTMFDPAKALQLTAKLGDNNQLQWDVPAGDWVVFRMGMTPTRTTNAPAAPEATGYEVDKMNAEHVDFHFDSYLDKIIHSVSPESAKALTTSVLDSYEVGGQNFTDGFIKRFQRAFGYDPAPFLPAYFGSAVGSRDQSDRFLWDMRRFVADEVAYSYVGGLRAASKRFGMKTWLECYGHWGFPGEFLQYGGQSNGIAGEYWSEGSLGDIENRAASSCGHIYGKRQIWCESNTCGGRPFARGPKDMKVRTDRFFAEGINSSLLHLYVHQPDEREPGFIAWFGNEFNRHNSWFDHMDVFVGYLKRCNFMLQQGLNVADIAYFIGEDAPKMTGITDPPPPRGRQFDYINGEVLRETAFVDETGRLSLPHGTKYEILVLPKLGTMRPELLARLEQLVNEGAMVIGPKPTRSPSLAGQPYADRTVEALADRLWGNVDGDTVKIRQVGKGFIAWNLPLDEALKLRKSATDCAYDQKLPVVFCHRTMPKGDIYFLANQSDQTTLAQNWYRFRVKGRIPELWNAETSEIRDAPEWRMDGDETEVRLTLAPRESVFVVFSRPAGKLVKHEGGPKLTVPLEREWEVKFASDPLHRGPTETVKMPQLTDWSACADPAIKYYSGAAVYTTTFYAPKSAKGTRVALALGKVGETAKVKVNGHYAGGIYSAPYELAITDYVKEGENTLEITVCSTWMNRLIGDDALKPEARPTWTSLPTYNQKHPLMPSGLIGPVSLNYEIGQTATR
ncbi:MAG: glycoside hydrolase family 2 [Kiritimatiellae bacterium]|nr:glycoside hydrolase family 2 [Kiritimatiellia bacterium]